MDSYHKGHFSIRSGDCAGERQMSGVEVGDWVFEPGRSYNPHGLVVGVYHEDGSPPYLVCWCDERREAMFHPGADTKLIRAADWRVPGPDTAHDTAAESPMVSAAKATTPISAAPAAQVP